MAYKNNPMVVLNADCIKGEDSFGVFDLAAGIQCEIDESYAGGRIDIDIRGLLKHDNVCLHFDAEELMAALTRAMVNQSN